MFKGVIDVCYFFLKHRNTAWSQGSYNLFCHLPHRCNLPSLLLLRLLRLLPSCCVVLHRGVCHIENLVLEVCQSPPDVFIQYQLVSLEGANLAGAGEKPPFRQFSLTLLSCQQDAAGAQVIQADLLVLNNLLGGKEGDRLGLPGASLESVGPTGMVDPGQRSIDCMELLVVTADVDAVGIKNPPSFLRLFIAYNLVTGNPRVDSWVEKNSLNSVSFSTPLFLGPLKFCLIFGFTFVFCQFCA